MRPDGNLFDDARPPETGERFEALWRCRHLMVERIISSDTPDPGLYVQAQDEWVVLLTGAARLEVDGATVSLRPGDHLSLPAGTPHRVLETSPGSLWLALHLHARNEFDPQVESLAAAAREEL